MFCSCRWRKGKTEWDELVQSRGNCTSGTCRDKADTSCTHPTTALPMHPCRHCSGTQPAHHSAHQLPPHRRLHHPHPQGTTTAPTGCSRHVSGIPVTSAARELMTHPRHGHLFVLVSGRLMFLMAHNHFSEVI